MEDLAAYKMFKDMAASNIFACVPEKIINEAKIQDIALDDWNIAISFLREWGKYTKELEDKISFYKEFDKEISNWCRTPGYTEEDDEDD